MSKRKPPPPTQPHPDALYLSEMHGDYRRADFIAAYEAWQRVSPDDRPLLMEFVRAGAINQVKLGLHYSQYKRQLRDAITANKAGEVPA